jgi:hypothetical protein
MAVERIFRCDGPDCERHVQTASTQPPVFLTVTEDAGAELHFCSWDCILKHAATKPPAEVIPVEPV